MSDRSQRTVAQVTLVGEPTDEGRTRPDTFRYCAGCDDQVLRSRWDDHRDHHREAAPQKAKEGARGGDPPEEDEDDEPERVGSMYEIELSYSVDFRFQIPAWSEHEAKERAEDLVDYPNNCADMFQVHSRDREISEILDDDPMLPEDYDPYGSEWLWEVYGDVE